MRCFGRMNAVPENVRITVVTEGIFGYAKLEARFDARETECFRKHGHSGRELKEIHGVERQAERLQSHQNAFELQVEKITQLGHIALEGSRNRWNRAEVRGVRDHKVPGAVPGEAPDIIRKRR